MSWLNKMFNKEPETPTPEKGVNDGKFLHLELGSRVTVDPSFAKIYSDLGDVLSPPQAPNQAVEAVGTIDLGEDSIMYRYYLTDDAFIQVNTTNDEITDMVVFTYWDPINPDSREDFEAFYDQGGQIGAPTLTIDGKVYHRVWGANAVHLYERVIKNGSRYELDLYTMLYEREIPGTDKTELAVITAEDSDEEDFVVSIAVGLKINRADLDIT